MGNERPQDTAAELLDAIERALGAGTTSLLGTHTISAVDTTYRQMSDGTNPAAVADPTSDQKFIIRVFLFNMVSADTVDIRVDVESADGTYRSTNYNYTNAQTNQEFVDFEVQTYNTRGTRIMIRQTAGTARDFIYHVIAGQGLGT